MSKALVGQCVLIGSILFGVSLVPGALALGYVALMMWMPSYSKVADFDKLGFNLRLDLFPTGNETRDSGRYLSVIDGGSYHRVMIPVWDWPHRARTSIYSIDANHIAVLCAFGFDYQVTLKPFEFAPLVSDDGEQWQYLGAFDFSFPPGMAPQLEFFDAQVAECIPMGMTEPTTWTARPRAAARRAACVAPSTP